MTTALQLNPKSVNYLTPNIVFQNIKQNYENVILASNITASSIPRIYLDGSGRAQINGSITIGAASPTTNTALCQFPSYLVPLNQSNGDWYFPVTVIRAGAYIQNAVKIESTGFGVSGIHVTTPGSYATLPTFTVVGNGDGAVLSPIMKAVSATVGTSQSGSGSYAPNDTVEFSGGTFSSQTVLTVTNTQVSSATVASGGTGGATGVQTVTGTTGTGNKFIASVTVSGGTIIGINSIPTPGNYTVNPTNLTAEPVTGGGLTGATLNIKMGVLTVTPSIPGSYTVLPSSPASQGSTSGTGTGATFNILWGILGSTVVNSGSGYDSSSTLSITGGGGSGGGAATLVLGTGTAGKVTLVNAPNQNDIVHLDSINFLVDSYGV